MSPSLLRRSSFAAMLLAGTAFVTAAAPVNPPLLLAQSQPIGEFAALVSQVKPAVVSIIAKLQATQASRGDDGPPKNGEARGSGFIIAADGIIITNNHVVKDATKVTVTLDDGTELAATVLGRDARTDIAVLKVAAAKPLPYVDLGQSRDVRPGEWVVAMGNPFGLGGTVTAGIVSAVGRDIGAGPYDRFIQIDAPINHGNSGGPLFSQDGKVIGMNTAIFSPTGGSVGIGFAIPSDQIRAVAAQLQIAGHVTRGYIGVEAQSLTGATAKALRLPENGGALLAGITANGPAAKAGLEPGDTIEAVNGLKIATPKDLALAIADVAPGHEANLTVLRDGQTRIVGVKVGQLPDERQAAADENAPAKGPRLGLALAPLTPELRDRLDVPEAASGAVIRAIEPGSPAEAAGLRPGDVIVSVDRHNVASPAEAAEAIRGALDAKRPALALRVIRHGASAFVGVPINGS